MREEHYLKRKLCYKKKKLIKSYQLPSDLVHLTNC